jgi:glutaminyl-tRNA synthetase
MVAKLRQLLHWVSAKHAVNAEVRMYDHLFVKEDPDEVADPKLDWKSNLNPDSLKVISNAMLEPSLAGPKAGRSISVRTDGLLLRRS